MAERANASVFGYSAAIWRRVIGRAGNVPILINELCSIADIGDGAEPLNSPLFIVLGYRRNRVV